MLEMDSVNRKQPYPQTVSTNGVVLNYANQLECVESAAHAKLRQPDNQKNLKNEKEKQHPPSYKSTITLT